jgi:hypothetical protein
MHEPQEQQQTMRHLQTNQQQTEPRKDKDSKTRAIRTMEVISHLKGTLPQ